MPLSAVGYDVQRLLVAEPPSWQGQCEVIDARVIGMLRARNLYQAPLGPLRLMAGTTFAPLSDDTLLPPAPAPLEQAPPLAAGEGEVVLGNPRQADIDAALTALIASSSVSASFAGADCDLFTQVLTVPAERVSVQTSGQPSIAMAMWAGKVTGVAESSQQVYLEAPQIDTVMVYVVKPTEMEICAYKRVTGGVGGWAGAPYVAKGVTLPVHEADPSLVTPAAEYAVATARLIGGEVLPQSAFGQLAAVLRPPAAAGGTERNGERIVLTRSGPDQEFEELPFQAQLSALVLHPKLRRVLGFGIVDRHVTPGLTYIYRVIGHFPAGDLTDRIYDVQRVPTSTLLPAAFSIGDASFRFQVPVSVVLEPPPAAGALAASGRRGIRIDAAGYDTSWLLPFLGGWSAVIGLPTPVTRIVLDVAPGHTFKYAASDAWAFGTPPVTQLPPGPQADLTFPAPVTELRLTGTGVLFGLRIPSGRAGTVLADAYTQPITYAAQPLPAAPPVFTVYSLQQPSTPVSGPIDESTPVRPRPPMGFRLNWLPPAVGGIAVWPVGASAGPPIDALAYQIDHRRVTPPADYGPWEPIMDGDNLTLGSRDNTTPAVRLEPGCDLDELFPVVRPHLADAGAALHLRDIFGQPDPVTGSTRPAEPLGSYHQYRIRSVDAVGRVSATETLSNIARLEKHIPPPLPVGPQPESPPDVQGNLTVPPGPHARAIIRGAPGLTPGDIGLLGGHDNAVVVEWGWREHERELDPATTEFRVYQTRPLDVVDGVITTVASQLPLWRIRLSTTLPLVADELAGQWITSNGYPFQVVSNDAGTAPAVTVKMAGAQSNPQTVPQPAPGPVRFGRPLRPEHQRPAGWDERVAVIPLGGQDSYHYVFYDVLTLGADHPRDTIWVGVSAADDQQYVPDERIVGANASRPGNESGIATCAVTARYRGQPTFNVPPPLGDVPEIVTDEPTGRQVLVTLDVTALLPGALPAGTPIVLERCPADAILSRTSVSGTDVTLTSPDGSQQQVSFSDPGDAAAVLATLTSPSPQRLANKYLLHILVAAADPAAFFDRISDDIAVAGPVNDRLPPKPGRYLYLVRAADALGHVSDGCAIVPAIVRVPSIAMAAVPQRLSLASTGTSVSLTVAIGLDPDTTAALLFAAVTPAPAEPAAEGDAELLRVPNRRDLYPSAGIRLLRSNGTMLSPTLVKDLNDPDVSVGQDGTRSATLTITAPQDAWVTVWCYTLTRDFVASYPCGPFGIGVRP